jgi:putative transposase
MTQATLAPIASPIAVEGITTDARTITAARHLRAPDRLWICDISQIWGGTSWLYFAYVLDHGSGRCLGWSPHRVPHAELVAEALRQATTARRADFIPGPRFAAPSRDVPVVFGGSCRSAAIDFPNWAVPSAGDLALCDGFVGGMRRLADEQEMSEDRAWASMPEAQRAIARWIDFSYNPSRDESLAPSAA